jgi:phage baseplate assembly protein W
MKTSKPQTLDFFGRTIKSTFNISSGKTEIVEGEKHIKQILKMIFSTRKFSRPMRRRLGFSHNSIVLNPILSSLRSQVEYHAKESIESFGENRISIDNIFVDWEKSKGTSIYFVIKCSDNTTGQSYEIPHLWEHLR